MQKIRVILSPGSQPLFRLWCCVQTSLLTSVFYVNWKYYVQAEYITRHWLVSLRQNKINPAASKTRNQLLWKWCRAEYMAWKVFDFGVTMEDIILNRSCSQGELVTDSPEEPGRSGCGSVGSMSWGPQTTFLSTLAEVLAEISESDNSKHELQGEITPYLVAFCNLR